MIPTYYPSDPRAYLREELQSRKDRRPQYSLRAFARDLEMSASFLCEFLAGRQGMSRERVQWIGRKIQLSEDQVEHFWDLIESRFGRSAKDRKAALIRASLRAQNDKNRLSVEKFRFIADWYHLTLLELLTLPTVSQAPVELARILGVSEAAVEQALERLLSLNLIEVRDGSYRVLSDATVTGDEGTNLAVQTMHRQFLAMQAAAVEQKSVDQRESVSISFAIAQDDWDEFRKELQQCIVALATRYASAAKDKNQVVALATQAVTLVPPALSAQQGALQ